MSVTLTVTDSVTIVVESYSDDHEHGVPEAGVFWCTLVLINDDDDH